MLHVKSFAFIKQVSVEKMHRGNFLIKREYKTFLTHACVCTCYQFVFMRKKSLCIDTMKD